VDDTGSDRSRFRSQPSLAVSQKDRAMTTEKLEETTHALELEETPGANIQSVCLRTRLPVFACEV
jgi:hypothetical protein